MKVLLLLCLVSVAYPAQAEEWKSRSIYQLLTDRFYNPAETTCDNLLEYCGGTWQGIIQKLPYIQALGFDAIWISPVVEQVGEGSYHGYWASDLYKVNSRFGSEEDLKALVRECHARGIWVMVDVVANHMGPVEKDYQQLGTFREEGDYHEYCLIAMEDFDGRNQSRVENCRLAGLPDLKHENP